MHNKSTDAFTLVNHNPDIMICQNTLNVPRREEITMPQEEHIDNITTPLIIKTY
jgi:hypothetical protein